MNFRLGLNKEPLIQFQDVEISMMGRTRIGHGLKMLLLPSHDSEIIFPNINL